MLHSLNIVPSGLDTEVARDSGCDGLTAVLTPTVGVVASSDPGEVWDRDEVGAQLSRPSCRLLSLASQVLLQHWLPRARVGSLSGARSPVFLGIRLKVVPVSGFAGWSTWPQKHQVTSLDRAFGA